MDKQEQQGICREIGARTGGDIYIGVVGPARTGKSTFIKRFMETMVLPNITDEYRRERARDELPQSGSGRTVMTAEPKFVPEEAVEISQEILWSLPSLGWNRGNISMYFLMRKKREII